MYWENLVNYSYFGMLSYARLYSFLYLVWIMLSHIFVTNLVSLIHSWFNVVRIVVEHIIV